MTPQESRAQLLTLGDDAEDTVRWMIRRTDGSFESRRLQLLDTVPGVTGFYSEASSILAADFYDESRAAARATGRYAAVPVVLDRTVKIRRGVAWASEPLSVDDIGLAEARMAELIRSEMNRPYRDTIIENRRQDPKCVGWKRITSATGCAFCRALADRGAVYREDTANFAAHNNCSCTCAPAFVGQEHGPEASVMQYIASGRRYTARQKAQIKSWVSGYEDPVNPRKHVKISTP